VYSYYCVRGPYPKTDGKGRVVAIDAKLEDEQNGFRKQHSTIDKLSTLTNIVETRLKSKRSTFVAYIDFSKAYDSVNRDILWNGGN
jgi:hypothetical protein